MTDELQDRVQEPFTGFRFAPLVFTDPPTAPPPVPAAPVPVPVAAASLPVLPSVSSVVPPPETGYIARPLAQTFALERRAPARVPSTGALDWAAFVLAFLLPPLGVIAGLTAVVLGIRSKGWAAGLSKAAIAIGVVLSLVVTGGAVVLARNASAAAAHAAVVADSARWCGELRKDPATLSSSTYGWPAVAGTVTASLPAMDAYVAKWKAIAAVAPTGIRSETRKIEAEASRITQTVRSTRVLDDSENTSRMQSVVSGSTIPAWVSEYCG